MSRQDQRPPVVLYPTSRPISARERAIPSKLLAMAADLLGTGCCRRIGRFPSLPGATGPRKAAWSIESDSIHGLEYERRDRETIRIVMPDGVRVVIGQPGSGLLRPFMSAKDLVVERLRLASFCLSGEVDHPVDIRSFENGYGMGEAAAFLKAYGGGDKVQYMLRSPYKRACILDGDEWADDGMRDLFGRTHEPTVLVFTEPTADELTVVIGSVMGNAREFATPDPIAVLRQAAAIAERRKAVRR